MIGYCGYRRTVLSLEQVFGRLVVDHRRIQELKLGGSKVERQRRYSRVEAPKAPRGWDVGNTSSQGKGLGKG